MKQCVTCFCTDVNSLLVMYFTSYIIHFFLLPFTSQFPAISLSLFHNSIPRTFSYTSLFHPTSFRLQTIRNTWRYLHPFLLSILTFLLFITYKLTSPFLMLTRFHHHTLLFPSLSIIFMTLLPSAGLWNWTDCSTFCLQLPHVH